MATFRVRLVNRVAGVSYGNTPFPVIGISGKDYGHAFVDPAHGGPVIDMSLEDYDRDKWDLIGNWQMRTNQYWVPTFYQVKADPGKKLKEFNELQKRAKAAGVWKKGMNKAELEEALTTVVAD